MGQQQAAAKLAPVPEPKVIPYHVKFSSQILCGAKTESTCMVTEGWRIETDFEQRVVVVSRQDAHSRWESTIVPFESVAYIRCNETGQPPRGS